MENEWESGGGILHQKVGLIFSGRLEHLYSHTQLIFLLSINFYTLFIHFHIKFNRIFNRKMFIFQHYPSLIFSSSHQFSIIFNPIILDFSALLTINLLYLKLIVKFILILTFILQAIINDCKIIYNNWEPIYAWKFHHYGVRFDEFFRENRQRN